MEEPGKKKDEVESIFIDLMSTIGMEIPNIYENIVQFIYEDILDTADPDNWTSEDVIISFRRWIESKLEEDEN